MLERYKTCTVFTPGLRNQVTGVDAAGTVRTYLCSMSRGGSKTFTTKKGAEFSPMSIYWVRAGDLQSGTHSEIREGEMIAEGAHTALVPPANAELIRSVQVHDHSKFNEADSYTIGTSE